MEEIRCDHIAVTQGDKQVSIQLKTDAGLVSTLPLIALKPTAQADLLPIATTPHVAPQPFQTQKTRWEGRGEFHTLMAVPFAVGRTFRTTPDGRGVTFTVSDTRGYRAVQVQDTTAKHQERRVILVMTDGSRQDYRGSNVGIINRPLDQLWARKMGKPPVYDIVEQGYQEWTATQAFVGRTSKPIKEIRLEVRPSVEVPNEE